VLDTGTGMAPGVAQQATNVFVTTKPHGKGTGLGLRMAHPFASTYRGKISIETALGQGTAVRFSLPYTGEAELGRPAVAGLSITACSALLRCIMARVEATVFRRNLRRNPPPCLPRPGWHCRVGWVQPYGHVARLRAWCMDQGCGRANPARV